MIFLGNPRTVVQAEVRRHTTGNAAENSIDGPRQDAVAVRPDVLADDPTAAGVANELLVDRPAPLKTSSNVPGQWPGFGGLA